MSGGEASKTQIGCNAAGSTTKEKTKQKLYGSDMTQRHKER